jgi:gamma-glutamyltranspeptidase/glutathione hydrolase
LHLFAEASRRAQAERQLFVIAPESLSVEERRVHWKRTTEAETWLKPHPIAPDRATPSSDLHPGYAKSLAELEHTTHLSVIDGEGGLVSLTVTLSGSYGARIFTKNTGFALNNSTASFSSVGVNTPEGGRRTTSSMAPTLVLFGPSAALVLGSPGGDTIPSTISQVFLQLAMDKKSLKEAVEAPRVHQTFAPGSLTTEKGRPLEANLARALEKMGHHIVERSSTIGDANTAVQIADMTYAVCDSREGGAALAASR